MDMDEGSDKEEQLEHENNAVAFKQGKPGDLDLDELALKVAAKWQKLGLHLGISQDVLDDTEANEKEKPYRMLLHWRNTTTSTTLYRDLYNALCHHRVGLNNVAKEFCEVKRTLPSSFQSSPQDPKRAKLSTSNKAGSSSQGIPPSSWEHSQPPFLAGTQAPAQTYQTSHSQISTYQPSSMEYCRIPSNLTGQTCEGPSYQTWHSPNKSGTQKRRLSPSWSTPDPKQVKHKTDLPGQMFVNLQQMQRNVSKVISNTDLLAELEKIASDKGFVISDNEESGNCMFYALSEQLNLVKGIKISHGELRQSIVQYLRKNPKLPDGTGLFNFIDRYQSWAEYLSNMEQDGTWGDHVILYGTANCYKTYIHVISSQSNHRDLTIRPDGHVMNTNPLVLGHVCEVHYVSLQPKQVSDSEQGENSGTQDCYDNPRRLSFKVPRLSDLTGTYSEWNNVELPVDFLVLTVEDCEFRGFFSYLKNPIKSYNKDIGYVYFGSVGNDSGSKLKVALMKSSKGSAVPGGSLTIVKDAVRVLRPKAVFLVGACSGVNRAKVKLGDVVVSSKLTTTVYKTPASRDIGNLIRHAADGWEAPLENPNAWEVRVHCDGDMLSRPEGVGEDIIQRCPETIAVEMEGEGVFAAAHDLKTEWVVVKGIKSYADSSQLANDEWGVFASVMAASVVSNILSNPIVFKEWPNYQGGYSQLPFHAATQTHGESTYPTSHHPQSSFGWLPSSVEYRQRPTLAAQAHQGPEYQRIYSQSFSVQGRPPLSVEHNPLPFPACSQIPVQTSQTQSHDPHEEKRTLPSSFQSSPQDPKRAKLSASNKAETSPVNTFDLKTCQRRLSEHYQKTAKVPTTVWSSKFQVDLEQIYTRLSWVKQEQTTTGSSRKELSHYTDIFTEKTKSGVAKRILVQGETGIGKTTFVKKLLVDWSNLEEAKMDEEQKDALGKFDLVVSINLKEVSECQTFKEILSQSRVFPDDETSSVDNLLSYIGENQDKVLLLFDGYDEYRTGSEAEEKYGSRSNSPIFEIFHGNVLRDCTVLVTTRSSRSGELQEFADTHVEITGFNRSDQKDFMIKFLGSQTEVDGLLELLRESKLDDLARVPLLNLFFCLLWKEEKEKLKDGFKSETELFQAIVKHILQHSHKRRSLSNASQLKESDYNEILTEIGKVALEGLLRGDLLFKFGQLSEKVRGETSVIVGLLQVSEFGPSVEPKEMVSFIHKSIQEYLAAWFVTYRCVPEGNLGGIEQHACTVEDCMVLEKVFKFVSGLSNQGAEKVFEHFSLVRTRDLAMTRADADNQTDLPLYDLTERHWWFSNLPFKCFREVNTRTELLSRFLDCFGEIVPVPNYVLHSQFMPNVTEDVCTLAHPRTFAFRFWFRDSIPQKSVEQFIKCFHIPSTTQSAEFDRVCDFLDKFLIISQDEHTEVKLMTTFWENGCSLDFILRFSIDQFQFYITDLSLSCDDHTRLFTETTEISVPSVAANLCLEAESCLKFVRSLRCSSSLSDESMKCLGGAIKDCKQLRFIEITKGRDSVCDLLEQVPNPSKCSLNLGSFIRHDMICVIRECLDVSLTSAGAVKLSNLLPRFNSIVHLSLSFVDAEVDALITSITHSSLKKLRLSRTILTPAAAAALGRSLPKMSSLEIFELTGIDGNILQAEVMELLFGGFNKTMPLQELSFGGFNVKGCLTPLTNSLHFLSKLRDLCLEEVIMDDQDLSGLFESFRFLPNLETLCVESKGPAPADSSAAEVNTVYSVSHRNCEELTLKGISLSSSIAAMLGQLLPKMSSLKRLELTGLDGSVLPAEQIERLFDGFTEEFPLWLLDFSGFSVRGCLAPLTRSFSSFPNLTYLSLKKLNMDEHDLRVLLENFRFIPNLESLDLSGNPLGHAVTSIVPHVINLPKIRSLRLNETCSGEDLISVFQGLRHRGVAISPMLGTGDS